MKYVTIKLFLLSFLVFGSLTESKAQRTCGTSDHQEELLNNAIYAKWFNAYKKQVKSYPQNRNVTCSNPIIIPVAVHYNGTINTSNTACLISRAQDQIDVLNKDFGGYNADISNYCIISEACCSAYPPEVLMQGSCIQFCLATANHPSCEPSGNLIGGFAITVGQHTWPSASNNCWKGYFNFFVSDEDPPGQMNLLGLAPIGGAANPNGDGMFISASAFGGLGSGCSSGTGIDTNGTYNMGRTGTHEAGHYFGLDHIFDGCSNGDGIADTPNQELENYGCPMINGSTCISTAENTCGTQDFFFNFMDYVDDPCMFMFTENQGQLMYNTALIAGTSGTVAYKSNATVCDAASQPDYNPTLPNGCIIANPPIPDSSFEPSSGSMSICSNKPINFTNTSEGCVITGWTWTFSGAGVTTASSTEENPSVYVTQSGTLTVTLTTNNASGSDMTPASENLTITIIDSNDSSCNQCGSTFTDSGGINGNYSNDELITTTLCSPSQSSINVDFVMFRLEAETNCMYDELTVYDGPTVSSTFMGSYCGVGLSNAPGGGSVSSTGECLTFVFRSDQLVTDNGWEANVVCSIVVPVELSSFEAVAQGRNVKLEWNSASEINLDSYILERSIDGRDFVEITTISSKGLSHGSSYEYDDLDLREEQYYYRLKQMDLSGDFDYSKIVSVQLSPDLDDQKYTLYPNPNNGIFNIEGSTANEELVLSIYDRTGKRIREIRKSIEGEIFQLDLSYLKQGVYSMRINNGSDVQFMSLVILN